MKSTSIAAHLALELLSIWHFAHTTAFAFTIQPLPAQLNSLNFRKTVNSNSNISINSNSNSNSNKKSSTKLNDLSEWRDQFFEVPSEVTEFLNDNNENIQDKDEPLREICILPFPLDDVLLQGETKELCLYEDRFHQLFEHSTNVHNSVVAMGLLAPPAGILQNMPLCEIENYTVMNGETAFGTDFSILVTIRAVGRASLMYIQDQEDEDIDFLKGYCMETSDNLDTSTSTSSSSSSLTETGRNVVEYGNKIADQLEDMTYIIQQMEDRLSIWGGGDSSASSSSSSSMENIDSVSDDEDNGNFDRNKRDSSSLADAQMRRRILEAELEEEQNSSEDGIDDDDDDDDDDDYDDDEEMDRKSRLQKAFQIAKATDYQGYKVSSDQPATGRGQSTRSIQDLTALSWAYFCCENDPMDIISYRLRAIESVDLCGRLNLALSMMNERKEKLSKLLRDQAIDFTNDDDDESMTD
mmetsp:Transcript_5077/g.7488  ORF Transcript_5077/g.7488 Transcript_5077/m.7488 type:complete len:468 (+) Transcript_5077:292-1695(+)